MNFTLRPWAATDRESLARHANNPLIAQNMTDAFPHPYTLEKADFFITKVANNSPAFILAIEINSEAAGGIGLHPQSDIHQKNAELGYWLAEPYWGKGIITEAIRKIVLLGFEQLPQIERIFARPFGTNIGSQKALEKAGFSLEARLKNTIYKNGQFTDELIYAIRRNNS